jgi:RNA polymerase sigma-70 factor (ECF subfamily)
MTRISDRNILKKIKQGDTGAFEKLYDKYHLNIYNYIRSFVRDSYEAENVLKDVFISLWETRHKINEYMSIGSLLYRVARNKSLNVLRKEVNKKIYIEYLSVFYLR